METVKFQCGHCRNLMAVGTEFLGQQVRCPHCQGVVVAPATPPEPAPFPANPGALPADPPPAETSFLPPPRTADREDIFSPPEESEDLFGQPNAPRLEVPPPAAAPPVVNGTAAPAPSSEPVFDSTPSCTTPAEPPAMAPGDSTLSVAPASPFPSWMEAPAVAEAPPPEPASVPQEPAPAESPPREEAGSELPVPAPVVRRPARDSGGWFIPLVFVPLVFYAIGASFFVAWSIFKVNQLNNSQERQNPFEQLPDDGDDRGVNQNGKRISYKVQYPDRFATAPLPPEQRLTLGQTRRFGAIEITPLRVERKRVGVMVQGWPNPEPCLHDSLVLWLRFRNVSADQAFAPLDNYFDRWWQPGQLMPLTQLEAGKDRFCGGPAKWYPRLNKKNDKPEWVAGRKYADPEGLKPGEETEGFVCTNGDDPRAALVLFGERDGAPVAPPYDGSFLWRVQVRRGLISWKGRDRSATTVIGVEFGRNDIQG